MLPVNSIKNMGYRSLLFFNESFDLWSWKPLTAKFWVVGLFLRHGKIFALYGVHLE